MTRCLLGALLVTVIAASSLAAAPPSFRTPNEVDAHFRLAAADTKPSPKDSSSEYRARVARRRAAYAAIADRLATEPGINRALLLYAQAAAGRKAEAEAEATRSLGPWTGRYEFDAWGMQSLAELDDPTPAVNAVRDWLSSDVTLLNVAAFLGPLTRETPGVATVASRLDELGYLGDARELIEQTTSRVEELHERYRRAAIKPAGVHDRLFEEAKKSLAAADAELGAWTPVRLAIGLRNVRPLTGLHPLPDGLEKLDALVRRLEGQYSFSRSDMESVRRPFDRALDARIEARRTAFASLTESTAMKSAKDPALRMYVYAVANRGEDAAREASRVVAAEGVAIPNYGEVVRRLAELDNPPPAFIYLHKWLGFQPPVSADKAYVDVFNRGISAFIDRLGDLDRYNEAEALLGRIETRFDALKNRLTEEDRTRDRDAAPLLQRALDDVERKKTAIAARRKQMNDLVFTRMQQIQIEFQQTIRGRDSDDPTFISATKERDRSLAELGDWAEKNQPNNHAALAGLYGSLNRFDDAARHLQLRIDEEPSSWKSYRQLIETLLRCGRPADAVAACRTMLDRVPTDSEADAYFFDVPDAVDAIVAELLVQSKLELAEDLFRAACERAQTLDEATVKPGKEPDFRLRSYLFAQMIERFHQVDLFLDVAALRLGRGETGAVAGIENSPAVRRGMKSVSDKADRPSADSLTPATGPVKRPPIIPPKADPAAEPASTVKPMPTAVAKTNSIEPNGRAKPGSFLIYSAKHVLTQGQALILAVENYLKNQSSKTPFAERNEKSEPYRRELEARRAWLRSQPDVGTETPPGALTRAYGLLDLREEAVAAAERTLAESNEHYVGWFSVFEGLSKLSDQEPCARFLQRWVDLDVPAKDTTEIDFYFNTLNNAQGVRSAFLGFWQNERRDLAEEFVNKIRDKVVKLKNDHFGDGPRPNDLQQRARFTSTRDTAETYFRSTLYEVMREGTTADRTDPHAPMWFLDPREMRGDQGRLQRRLALQLAAAGSDNGLLATARAEYVRDAKRLAEAAQMAGKTPSELKAFFFEMNLPIEYDRYVQKLLPTSGFTYANAAQFASEYEELGQAKQAKKLRDEILATAIDDVKSFALHSPKAVHEWCELLAQRGDTAEAESVVRRWERQIQLAMATSTEIDAGRLKAEVPTAHRVIAGASLRSSLIDKPCPSLSFSGWTTARKWPPEKPDGKPTLILFWRQAPDQSLQTTIRVFDRIAHDFEHQVHLAGVGTANARAVDDKGNLRLVRADDLSPAEIAREVARTAQFVKWGFPMAVATDDASFERFGVTTYPTTIVVDRNGTTLHIESGWKSQSNARVRESLLRALGEAK